MLTLNSVKLNDKKNDQRIYKTLKFHILLKP